MVAPLADALNEWLPKSSRLGVRGVEDKEAWLRRTRDDWGVWGSCLDVGDMKDSSYRVEESAVDTDALGEPGRRSYPFWSYMRSRSARLRWRANLLNSVPEAVRAGFVFGAEIPRWPMVFTGCGGASLS